MMMMTAVLSGEKSEIWSIYSGSVIEWDPLGGFTAQAK